jgi:DNA modification methylase
MGVFGISGMAVSRRKYGGKPEGDEPLIIEGLAEAKLAEVIDNSVQTTITSPPYYRQKDYHAAGQIGWEPTVEQYVAKLKAILAELWRATAPSGSCFFVIGDSYMDKSLQLVPQRVALAACECGWTLRNDLLWAKSDAAPDGASDRWRFSHEHVLFLTKRARGYKFNDGEIRVPYSPVTLRRWGGGQQYGGEKVKDEAGPNGQRFKRGKVFRLNEKGTVPRDVIECATARSRLDHFATFPLELIEQFVLATSDRGELVLDPFAGTATTGVAAVRNGRRFVGIELNADYAKIGRSRLKVEEASTGRVA